MVNENTTVADLELFSREMIARANRLRMEADQLSTRAEIVNDVVARLRNVVFSEPGAPATTESDADPVPQKPRQSDGLTVNPLGDIIYRDAKVAQAVRFGMVEPLTGLRRISGLHLNNFVYSLPCVRSRNSFNNVRDAIRSYLVRRLGWKTVGGVKLTPSRALVAPRNAPKLRPQYPAEGRILAAFGRLEQ